MTRKEKILWIFYAAVLVFLFLLSSTDLIIKEQKTEIYPLSVIIEGSGDEHYMNFRKGMDRAAIELNADVRFISLYEENDDQQQLEMMVREQQDGARALIVTPTNEAAMERAISGLNLTVPLVLVDSDVASLAVSAVVTVDYFQMGQKLAKEVLRRHPDRPPVCFFQDGPKSDITARFEEGLRAVLVPAGYQPDVIIRQNDKTFLQAIEGTADQKTDGAVVIALDQESLGEAASILADSSTDKSGVKGLYGRGATASILNYLDGNVISGLCVTDGFCAGYLSVKRAVEAVTKQPTEKKTLMESYYIEKEDLRNIRYEKMLYPIE